MCLVTYLYGTSFTSFFSGKLSQKKLTWYTDFSQTHSTMTQIQMQQPAESIDTMFPPDSGAGPPVSENHVETQLPDSQTSLDDYNRTMLEYTQRQMSSFVDLDDAKSGSGSGTSSRSSQSSGTSGSSGSGDLARQANGPPPASAGAAAARQAARKPQKLPRSPNEAKPSLY